jgi:hypothetical protein
MEKFISTSVVKIFSEIPLSILHSVAGAVLVSIGIWFLANKRRPLGAWTKAQIHPNPVIWRFQQIPRRTTKEDLKRELEQRYCSDDRSAPKNILRLSLAPYSDSFSCATVTFETQPSALKEGFNNTYICDTRFLGLTPLYDGEGGNASVECVFCSYISCSSSLNYLSIVCVPGLATNAIFTWKSILSAQIWLRDWLPEDIPESRVLVYGYDTSLIKDDGRRTIVDLAKTLLESLKSFRAGTGVSQSNIFYCSL